MAIFPGSAIPSAVSDYEIDNSLRFNAATDPRLTKTIAVSGNRKTFTISLWFKRSNLGLTNTRLFSSRTSGSDEFEIHLNSSDELSIYFYNGSYAAYFLTSQKFRDPSAWYHLCYQYDSPQATASDRMKMWINGEQVTAFQTETNPSQDLETSVNKATSDVVIGDHEGALGSNVWDGYIAEWFHIDGQSLPASTFGELSSTTNQWKPLDSDDVKDAVTFGTNGFFQKYNSTELANSFLDNADVTAKTFTVNGNAHTDTSIKKFGTASAQFDGTGDWLASNTSNSFVWRGGTGTGIGDFTLEAWVYPETPPAGWGQGVLSTYPVTGGSQVGPIVAIVGSVWYVLDDDWHSTGVTITTGSWQHIALVRSGTGTNLLKFYLDGVKVYEETSTVDFTATSYQAVIAATNDASGYNYKGYIDEVRFSNIARYTANFDVPTAAFEDDQYTKLLMHMDGANDGTTFTDSSGTADGRHVITANGDVKNVRGANLDTTYTNINAFTSTGSDTWTCPAGVTSVKVLSVAGGAGGAGSDYGGGAGGGAGGLVYVPNYTVVPGVVYDLTVGAGGAGTLNTYGVSGGDSVFNVNAEGSGSTLTSKGGGGGYHSHGDGGYAGRPGGSGGGGGHWSGGSGGAETQTSESGDSGTYGFGNAGGSGDSGADGNYSGGGGGGAGAAGGNSSGSATATGGVGKDYSSVYGTGYGASGWFAGGGGGGASSSASAGGTGGGGAGATGGSTGTAATANTGGGGGGSYTGTGGSGGSGVIIIAWDGTKPGSSSIKFDGSGDYLSTHGADSDFAFGTENWTIEFWIRFSGGLDAPQRVINFAHNTSPPIGGMIETGADNKMVYYEYTLNSDWTKWCYDTNAYVLDTWYHYAVVREGSDFTMYRDGVEQESDGTSSGSLTSAQPPLIGTNRGISAYTTGYMDEIRISNTARYTAAFTPQRTQFTADANTKLLIHSDYTGGLGADSSGNYNNFAATNLVATDQMIDTPTNNWCTFNPLIQATQEPTLSEGNLQCVSTSGTYGYFAGATFGVSSGKWYAEYYHKAGGGGCIIGIIPYDQDFGTGGNYVGSTANTGTGYYGGGQVFNYDNAGNVDSGPASYDTGDIIGVALDLDDSTGKVYFYKNGALQDTGLTNDAGNNYNLKTVSTYWTFGCGLNADWTNVANFGADSSFAGNFTAQGNQDGNEKGDFYYTPPSGYLALCSDNLSDPEIALPGENFDAQIWAGTGDGSSSGGKQISTDFAPDFVWIKSRSDADSHYLFDDIRGANEAIKSDTTGAEITVYNALDSFDSDGYTLGYDPGGFVNYTGRTFVGWSWKAGGAPTVDNSAGAGATPTAGSVKIDGSNLGSALAGTLAATRLSANTTAGMSVVGYTGIYSNATVAHGLSVAPELILIKNRSSVLEWKVYNATIGNTKVLYLDATDSAQTGATSWNDTTPSASVFTIGTNTGVNENTSLFVAYCFHSVEGYSKVGSYEGNGNADGAFVYTGFSPAMVIIKNIDDAQDWSIIDNKRPGYNEVDEILSPNLSNAEDAGTALDFTSNGFKCRNGSDINNDAKTMIYIAFAESPFKTSNAR